MTSQKDFRFGAVVAIIPIFWLKMRENASFFDASIFDPIFQSENGKLSRNVKPCLRYNITGIWFYCVSKQHAAATFYHIIFCNENNGVFTAKKLWQKLVKR